MSVTQLDIDGITVEVRYYFDGEFYPETRESPASYPELVIQSITVDGVDVTDWSERLGVYERLEEITRE